jgi:hypothetical protein
LIVKWKKKVRSPVNLCLVLLTDHESVKAFLCNGSAWNYMQFCLRFSGTNSVIEGFLLLFFFSWMLIFFLIQFSWFATTEQEI